ncbi:helicase-associated domain-containing protein [Brevibacterium yomogidense]|uniref:helicase-associated domain-containing protein n=1 Tax=Brevibacterium yomogidense TaxID=946573 RepID=UPI0018E03307|nr:helicase-associated domain-containing protein [Brevibacterium yomogidense]
MPESPSFAAWLRTAPEPWFRAFAATRADLLRTDVTDVARLAVLAASRAAVARGLESLDASALRVVHRAAVLARVNPAVDREELLDAALGDAPQSVADRETGAGRTSAPEAALTAAIHAGLLWPAGGDGDPAEASAYRVQPEAGGLLPVTAAERAHSPHWATATDPRPLATSPVSAALLENAQGAGAAAVTSLALTVVAEFGRREVSQLVSGGVGKREAQALARAAGTEPGRFTLLVELASHLGWLATTRDPADPQWKPTAEFDTAAAAPREQVWADLVTAWLTHPVDIAHVLAGTTPAGERIHLLGRDDHARTAFGGFPASRPQILTLRKLVLVALLREGRPDARTGEGEASAHGAEANAPRAAAAGTGAGGASGAGRDVHDDQHTAGRAVRTQDLVGLLGFTHPLLSAVRTDEIDQVLDEAEAFGLTASPLGSPDAHALTPFGRSLATWVEEHDDPFDVLGVRDGLDAGPPLPLREAVAALLPPLETRVTLQSDLSGVAFGPLDHEVRMRLERIADIDTRGQGSVYRFTDESITRGLRAGESVESILATLAELSETGVPTTLEHMVNAAGSRLHRVRVARARSVIVVDDPTDLDVLLDDPAAVAIGLRRLAATVAVADASSDRVSVLLETEDRPILRVDPGAEDAVGTRAPVPALASPTTTRTTRVPASRIPAHIDALVTQRVTGSMRRTSTQGTRGTTAQSGRGAGGAGQTGAAGAAASAGMTASAGMAASAGNTSGSGAVGPDAAQSALGDTQSVLAELGEAAAVAAPVDLVVTTSDGTHRTVRLVPQVVQAGRVMGRTDAGKALRVSVSRIVQVRRSGGRGSGE